MRYNVKLWSNDENPNLKTPDQFEEARRKEMLKKRRGEAMLQDLLNVLPTLKKHKLEGEIHSKVRTLRDGRRQRHYTLEVSRQYNPFSRTEQKYIKELKVSAPITKGTKKVELLKQLKDQIIEDIRKMRKEAQLPIENYTFDREQVTVKKLAEVYLEHETFAKLAARRIRLQMESPKSPKTQDRHVGIEIELASQETRTIVCDRLFEAGVGRYICIKHDGSIGRDSDLLLTHPHENEITVLVPESQFESVITKICDVLNNTLHCKVDKTCGLHVHLDMRTREKEKCFNNLIAMQHLLYAMNPSYRKGSRFSVPLADRKWKIPENHYHGVTSHPYNRIRTIEVRMHCGTLQARKINNWIKLLIAIADAPLVGKAPTRIKDIQTTFNLSDAMMDYVQARIAKFSKQHKEVKNPDFFETVEAVAVFPDHLEVVEQSEEVA